MPVQPARRSQLQQRPAEDLRPGRQVGLGADRVVGRDLLVLAGVRALQPGHVRAARDRPPAGVLLLYLDLELRQQAVSHLEHASHRRAGADGREAQLERPVPDVDLAVEVVARLHLLEGHRADRDLVHLEHERLDHGACSVVGREHQLAARTLDRLRQPEAKRQAGPAVAREHNRAVQLRQLEPQEGVVEPSEGDLPDRARLGDAPGELTVARVEVDVGVGQGHRHARRAGSDTQVAERRAEDHARALGRLDPKPVHEHRRAGGGDEAFDRERLTEDLPLEARACRGARREDRLRDPYDDRGRTGVERRRSRDRLEVEAPTDKGGLLTERLARRRRRRGACDRHLRPGRAYRSRGIESQQADRIDPWGA